MEVQRYGAYNGCECCPVRCLFMTHRQIVVQCCADGLMYTITTLCLKKRAQL